MCCGSKDRHVAPWPDLKPGGLVGVQSLPLISSVTLGKIDNLSVLQFPYLKNGDNTSTHFMRVILRIK